MEQVQQTPPIITSTPFLSNMHTTALHQCEDTVFVAMASSSMSSQHEHSPWAGLGPELSLVLWARILLDVIQRQ
jgi:hypothetical protein